MLLKLFIALSNLRTAIFTMSHSFLYVFLPYNCTQVMPIQCMIGVYVQAMTMVISNSLIYGTCL